MSAIPTTTTRQVIPRWRPWRLTTRLGELGVAGHIAHDLAARAAAEAALAHVRLRESADIGWHLEAISVIRSLGDRSQSLEDSMRDGRVTEPADALLEDPRRLLDVGVGKDPNEFDRRPTRIKVAFLKEILAREPRNAVRWVDLAREYMSLGQHVPAARAMSVAQHLCPDDRFVLRSAAAMHVRLARPDRALALLEASPRTNSDPWLLASTVAIRDHIGQRSRSTKATLGLVEDSSPFEIAELAAALATVELRDGSERQARKLLRMSLRAPTENAAAQAEFLLADYPVLDLEQLGLDVPRAYEAHARRSAGDLDWSDATQHARDWLEDQPFSIDAAGFASWAACEGELWDEAMRVVRSSTIAIPNNATLLNNLAFAQASSGDLANAISSLRQCRKFARGRSAAVSVATEGLVCFRAGLPTQGRHRYQMAIDWLLKHQERSLAAKASIMLAREELLQGTTEASSAFAQVDRLMRNQGDLALNDLAVRVRKLAHPAQLPSAQAATAEAVRQALAAHLSDAAIRED